MTFNPDHGADHLSHYDLERDQVEEWHTDIDGLKATWDEFKSRRPGHVHAPEVPESPSCGPGKHHITMVPVCFDCGAVFGADHE